MSANRTFDYAFFYKRRQDLVNSRNQYLNNVNGQRIIFNTQLSDWNASRQATFDEGATTMVFRGTYGNGEIISPGGIINIPPYPQESEVVITAPSAPIITSIDPGNQQLIVNFTPPTSNGGGDITDYEYSTDNGSNWISAGATISPFTISSLSIGTTYDVKIRAVNSAGAGAESNMIQGTTWNVPSAPTISSITSGNQQLTVNFTAPTSNGGTPITEYQYSTNNGASFLSGGLNSPIVITGLTNGQTYQVILRAFNVVGGGANSNIITATPATTPSAPTITSITSGDQQLTVNFTAGSDGGSAITNYEYSTNGGTSFTPFSPADTTSPVVITGLTNGTSYSVRIRAVNSVGSGGQSNAVSATPAGLPSPPTSLSGAPGNQQAIISFTAGSNGGSAITNYEYSTDGGVTFIPLNPVDTKSPVTITTLSSDGTTQLTNNTTYTIQLKAVNAIGVSSASTSVNVTPVPGIDVIILGDSNVTTLSTSIQSAKTALGYSVSLNITTQQLNGYTGTNLSSFDVVIFYTNGGLNLNATLGANLNTFVSNGGHLIMASFSWGNVQALSGFTYNSYSTYQYKGTYSSVNANTAVYTITHPITTGIATSTGLGSPNIPNPISLTTIPNSQVIATFADAGSTSFIAVGQNGSARLVGINAYVVVPYSGNFQNTIKYVCNSIYWCMSII